MISGSSHQLGKVAPMAVDTGATDTGLRHDTFTAMVGQMVVQCRALLRQQLEHKATKQPLYTHERIGRVIANFEARSSDIQDAIAARVMSRLTHHVQQEGMRVLQDALADAAQSLEDPLWEQANTWGNAGWLQRRGTLEDETVAEELVEEPTRPEPASTVESRVEEIASSVDEPGHDEDAPQSGGIG